MNTMLDYSQVLVLLNYTLLIIATTPSLVAAVDILLQNSP